MLNHRIVPVATAAGFVGALRQFLKALRVQTMILCQVPDLTAAYSLIKYCDCALQPQIWSCHSRSQIYFPDFGHYTVCSYLGLTLANTDSSCFTSAALRVAQN